MQPETVAVKTTKEMPNQDICSPVVPSISVASTYIMKSIDHFPRIFEEGYVYSRDATHSSDCAAEVIKELEGGQRTLVFSSGMAAISTTLLTILKAGDHMIAPTPVYSGTDRLLSEIICHYGIEVSWVNSADVKDYKKLIKPNTKLLYGETPCNPTMTILDLEKFGKLGKSLPGVFTVVDSTFASPWIQKPLDYGIDIAIQSCTKYLGGHNDILAGAATSNNLEFLDKLKEYRIQFGNILAPFDSFLLLRGLRTLHVRMERHSSNAMKVAEYLENHPKVLHVWYPGLPSHPHHEVAKKQMKLFGGMLSFELKGGMQAGIKLVENVKIPYLAESLGGVASLIEHAPSMTHSPLVRGDTPSEDNIPEGLIRFSIGLEHSDDLIADLENALGMIELEE